MHVRSVPVRCFDFHSYRGTGLYGVSEVSAHCRRVLCFARFFCTLLSIGELHLGLVRHGMRTGLRVLPCIRLRLHLRCVSVAVCVCLFVCASRRPCVRCMSSYVSLYSCFASVSMRLALRMGVRVYANQAGGRDIDNHVTVCTVFRSATHVGCCSRVALGSVLLCWSVDATCATAVSVIVCACTP